MDVNFNSVRSFLITAFDKKPMARLRNNDLRWHTSLRTVHYRFLFQLCYLQTIYNPLNCNLPCDKSQWYQGSWWYGWTQKAPSMKLIANINIISFSNLCILWLIKRGDSLVELYGFNQSLLQMSQAYNKTENWSGMELNALWAFQQHISMWLTTYTCLQMIHIPLIMTTIIIYFV